MFLVHEYKEPTCGIYWTFRNLLVIWENISGTLQDIDGTILLTEEQPLTPNSLVTNA